MMMCCICITDPFRMHNSNFPCCSLTSTGWHTQFSNVKRVWCIANSHCICSIHSYIYYICVYFWGLYSRGRSHRRHRGATSRTDSHICLNVWWACSIYIHGPHKSWCLAHTSHIFANLVSSHPLFSSLLSMPFSGPTVHKTPLANMPIRLAFERQFIECWRL